MTWSHLLPEGGEEPAGFVDPSPSRRRDPHWQAQPLPANPRKLSLDAAIAAAYAALGRRQHGAAGTVRAWPADDRRLMLLRIHIDAVRHPGPPDDGPSWLMPTLICDRIRWTRADLIWALRTADDWGLYDGAAFLLLGYIAASLTPDELAGCEPALRAVFDTMLHQRQTPQATRWQVTALIGKTLGRLTHRLPPHLLHAGDHFGPLARRQLGERLDTSEAAQVLAHAVSLTKPAPTKAWLHAARQLPTAAPARAVLGCFTEFRGPVHENNDQVLRGLTWMLSPDTDRDTTDLLARVAATAGSAAAPSRYPVAPRTAAAAVTILAERPGDVATQTLTELSLTVRNKPLLAHVCAALDRLNLLQR
jgi:hypothetical protein